MTHGDRQPLPTSDLGRSAALRQVRFRSALPCSNPRPGAARSARSMFRSSRQTLPQEPRLIQDPSVLILRRGGAQTRPEFPRPFLGMALLVAIAFIIVVLAVISLFISFAFARLAESAIRSACEDRDPGAPDAERVGLYGQSPHPEPAPGASRAGRG